MTSKLAVSSCKRISKSTLPVPEKYPARHSMLKMRLGAVPDTEVKIPQPPVHVVTSVRRSSQCGKIAGPSTAEGKQVFENVEVLEVNKRRPLESAPAEV